MNFAGYASFGIRVGEGNGIGEERLKLVSLMEGSAVESYLSFSHEIPVLHGPACRHPHEVSYCEYHRIDSHGPGIREMLEPNSDR